MSELSAQELQARNREYTRRYRAKIAGTPAGHAYTDAQNARRRERYATDPDFKAKVIARNVRRDKRIRETGVGLEKHRTRMRRSYIRRAYGMSLEDFDALRVAQGHKCAICHAPLGEGKKQHIDHCHTTGKIRGVLCGACNKALGGFKDSPEVMRRAAEYIERSKAVLH